jgi:hypothetical protein
MPIPCSLEMRCKSILPHIPQCTYETYPMGAAQAKKRESQDRQRQGRSRTSPIRWSLTPRLRERRGLSL